MPRALAGAYTHARHAKPPGSGSPFLHTLNALPNVTSEKGKISSFRLLPFPLWASSWSRALTSGKEYGDAELLVCDVGGGGRAPGSMTSPGALFLPPHAVALRWWDEGGDARPGFDTGAQPQSDTSHHFRLGSSGSLPPPRRLGPGKVTAAGATAAISAPQEVRAALRKVSHRRGT